MAQNLDRGRQLMPGMFFALQFILVVSERAISHGYTGGRTPFGIIQEMAIQTGHRYRYSMIPKYPKSRYANRDLPIQGGGARHNK
jgi:hypothetical protein